MRISLDTVDAAGISRVSESKECHSVKYLMAKQKVSRRNGSKGVKYDNCDSSSNDSDECESLDDSEFDPDYVQSSSDHDSTDDVYSSGETDHEQDSDLVIVTDVPADSSQNVGTDVTADSSQNVSEHLTSSSVTVARSQNSKVFDKRPYCYYCGVQQAQVQRHWMSKHTLERDVIEIEKCKDKVEKRRLIARLRNLGNHFHNVDVLRKGQGELLVTHRKNSNAEAANYVPCEQCYAYVLKRELWRHKCKFGKPQKGRVAQNAELLLPAPSHTTPEVYELVCSMKDDDVRFVAKSDDLIMEYAKKLIHTKGMKKKCYIRDKLREISRFLIEVRKHAGMETAWMKDCISPQHFTTCLSAVKQLAGFDSQTASYKTPSLALKVGHALKKLTKILKRHAIEKRAYHTIADIDYFHDLCESEWGDEIAHSALMTLRHQKRNKINLLPVASDVTKLVSYLRQRSTECCEKLPNADGSEVQKLYRELTEVTLAYVITFNRRRQGEVAQITLDDYNNKSTVDASSDIYSGLSRLEQNMCKLFSRIEIRGKRDAVVPVLLTEDVRRAIDVLVDTRSSVGVKETNEYVFALTGSDNYIRGSDALRKAASQCGAENPQTLTSTNFRKHIATLSQLIDLKDHELDALAQFMGHDIRVHRKFYRLPNDVVQTSQLAKIFLLMEKGELATHKGKSLDELMSAVTEDTGDISVYLILSVIL